MVMSLKTSASSAARSALPPKTIGAGAFKARCLELMDEVAATGAPLVITKRGKPVAQLVQMETERPSLFGRMRGEIEILGDIVSPAGPTWDPGDLSLFDSTPKTTKVASRPAKKAATTPKGASSRGRSR